MKANPIVPSRSHTTLIVAVDIAARAAKSILNLFLVLMYPDAKLILKKRRVTVEKSTTKRGRKHNQYCGVRVARRRLKEARIGGTHGRASYFRPEH